ncbi:MAG: energy-coupling factor ABC transporter ATP-binding protein [Candidatus Ranarchaeia archaeon]|jgi:energy-coupling factor transport system ATP-binding protein
MIETHNVRFGYEEEKDTLCDVSLQIDDGEIIAIMGQNGAGKTTLAKHLNGLLKPRSGEVIINGVSTNEFSVAELSKTVGYVFQNPNHSLFAESVEQEILFTLKNYGFSNEEKEQRLEETLETFNLKPFRDTSPFSLSGGERKRVSLAAVLCLTPDIVILDEPTTGQDAKQKKTISGVIERLHQEGKTLILISHDTEFVVELVDRIIVMAEGEIIADGKTEKILSNQQILDVGGLQLPELTRFAQSVAKSIDFPMDLVRMDEVVDAIKSLQGGR